MLTRKEYMAYTVSLAALCVARDMFLRQTLLLLRALVLRRLLPW